jgi:RNA polymerase-binding protein DksA
MRRAVSRGRGSAKGEAARGTPPEEGAQKKPAQKKPAQKKPAQKKPAQKKPAQKKPAQKKPAQKKPAQKKPAQKKPATTTTSATSTRTKTSVTKTAAKTAAKTTEKKTTRAKTQKSGISPKTLERLVGRLREERSTYTRQAEDLAAEAEALMEDREPGDTQFDEESGEGDTISVERERDLALSATARAAVEEIDAALERVKAGTYGICLRCGKNIPVARLEAVPHAALCIDCKSRQERRR